MALQWYSFVITQTTYTTPVELFNGYFSVDTTTNTMQHVYDSSNLNDNLLLPVDYSLGNDNKFISNKFTFYGFIISRLNNSNDTVYNASKWLINEYGNFGNLRLTPILSNGISNGDISTSVFYVASPVVNPIPPQWYSFVITQTLTGNPPVELFNGYFSVDTTTNIIQNLYSSSDLTSNLLLPIVANLSNDNAFISNKFTSDGTLISSISSSFDTQNNATKWLLKDEPNGGVPVLVPILSDGSEGFTVWDGINITYSQSVNPIPLQWYSIQIDLTNNVTFNGYFSVDTTTNIIQNFYSSSDLTTNLLIPSTNSGENIFQNGHFSNPGAQVSSLTTQIDSLYNARGWQIGETGPINGSYSYLLQADSLVSNLNIYIPLFVSGATYTVTQVQSPISNICFLAGTPIATDQGLIPIEQINTSIHTIKNKKIDAITKTISLDNYLVCFEKDSLSKNIPSQKTIMTKNHRVLYEGNLVPAYTLLDVSSNIKKIKYNGEKVYNVLLKEHTIMNVNNLICETLHPKHGIAVLHNMLNKLDDEYKTKLINKYNTYVIQNKIYRQTK